MDLGLQGRKAIVCASSRGLGRACAMALAHEGVAVVVNGRNADQLETTADAPSGGSGGFTRSPRERALRDAAASRRLLPMEWRFPFRHARNPQAGIQRRGRAWIPA